MPIPTSSIGESEPEVTSPPSAMAMPTRGIALSTMTNAVSRRRGPSSLTRRSSSTPVNSLSSAETQPLDRPRPLNGEQRVLVGDVADVRPAELPLLQPLVVGPPVRRVHDQQEAIRLELVDDQVVDDPAALVREERVLRLADADPVEVVGEEALEELPGARAFDLELAHVGHVEDAAVG